MTDTQYNRLKKRQCILATHYIAQYIKSPLSTMDIDILLQYGTINTPLRYTDYKLIENVWYGVSNLPMSLTAAIDIDRLEMYDLAAIQMLITRLRDMPVQTYSTYELYKIAVDAYLMKCK